MTAPILDIFNNDAFSLASLPVTDAPILCSNSAKPHIPIPPIPIK